jgi:hypothetical protein
MKIKDGVIMSGLQLPMRPVLLTAEKIYRQYDAELVITSALEGTHSAGSLHYYGYALDMRTRDVPEELRPALANSLRKNLEKLSEQYRVILEPTHIHVEWRGFIHG